MSIPTTVIMTKKDGKLISSDVYSKTKMDIFLESLKEGQQIEVTYELKHKNASYGQMARVHASIRALANETGASFEEMKETIKQRCGLVIGDNIKSFADCSKEELGKAIQECITVGELLGVNLH